MAEEKGLSALENLSKSLSKVEVVFDDIRDRNYEEIHERLNPIESAKLNVSLAYSAASLFYILLRCQVLCLCFLFY